jgi:membrane protease YdiL (CAAX protease family)
MTIEPPRLRTPFARWRHAFFVEPLRRADDEMRAYLASDVSRRLDRKTLALLLCTALLLTCQYYFSRHEEVHRLADLLGRLGLANAGDALHAYLYRLAASSIDYWTWWALSCFCCYFVAPALIIRLGFRERLADYGFKLRGAFADWWVYLILFAFVGPLVLLMSCDPQFQTHYPFYPHPRGEPLWPNLWRWELVYSLQFVGVEFLFRGFLLHGLRRRFGAYCIPLMMVPYCMIHFGKPLPETLASIVAGLGLGFLSLKNRSIVLGVAIHLSVALSMDFASLWQKGFFQ